MVGSIICGLDNSGSAHGAARVTRGLSSKLGLPVDCGARIARFVPGARRTQDGNRGEDTWPTKL